MALYAQGESLYAIYTSKNYNVFPARDALIKLEVLPHIQRNTYDLYILWLGLCMTQVFFVHKNCPQI